ncbi:hypothetical protein PHLGIDRAFT_114788 [Phlebiopsis gigantea 11061_1 CR5-6]|uniref:Uncharacterized protein n=1 Tax=Phlebiopsis gigantea (strain 11061_1 CR5-6) TaxID=745531 RepID=A0A0C3SCQ2_PHLG1|nr:hypothetical protein PHLGIDRAFT_114788 [Phlebiopsis gigantea 11061_1 CR5-6]
MYPRYGTPSQNSWFANSPSVHSDGDVIANCSPAASPVRSTVALPRDTVLSDTLASSSSKAASELKASAVQPVRKKKPVTMFIPRQQHRARKIRHTFPRNHSNLPPLTKPSTSTSGVNLMYTGRRAGTATHSITPKLKAASRLSKTPSRKRRQSDRSSSQSPGPRKKSRRTPPARSRGAFPGSNAVNSNIKRVSVPSYASNVKPVAVIKPIPSVASNPRQTLAKVREPEVQAYPWKSSHVLVTEHWKNSTVQKTPHTSLTCGSPSPSSKVSGPSRFPAFAKFTGEPNTSTHPSPGTASRAPLAGSTH